MMPSDTSCWISLGGGTSQSVERADPPPEGESGHRGRGHRRMPAGTARSPGQCGTWRAASIAAAGPWPHRPGNMLEGSCCGQTTGSFSCRDQLDGVEGVQKVDVAGLAVQHLNRQVRAIFHINAAGLLVGVAAVFQCQFVHCCILLIQRCICFSVKLFRYPRAAAAGSSSADRCAHFLKIMSPVSV